MEQIERKIKSLMPNFVIPMAGRGQRFIDAGYKVPKYMIKVHGKTLLEWSLESLPLDMGKKVIFICLKEHDQKFSVSQFIEKTIKTKFPRIEYEIILLDKVTRGQAETVLSAKKYINNSDCLVIYNIDTYFESSRLRQKLLTLDDQGIDGLLGVFTDTDPKWSFIELDSSGFVKRVIEKNQYQILHQAVYTHSQKAPIL